MTRTATALAWEYYEGITQQDEGALCNNVVDFDVYRQQRAMPSRHYVLVPVEEPVEVASTYTPRPRRNHRNAAVANFIHTALNLAIIGATFILTAQLVGMI